MKVWHYTTSKALEGIFNDGVLECDRIYIKGEIPCIWLSTNSNWEETVRKKIQNAKTGVETKALSRNDLLKFGVAPIRIEINPKAIKIVNWKIHCKKIPKNIIQALEDVAKEWGANPSEWWVSYKPIPVNRFASIETWNGETWVEVFKKGQADGR